MGKIFEVLARSKTTEILFALKGKALKFNELIKIAGNATTAMRRTQELQTAGLIARRVLQDKQRTVEYSLTKKGEDLIPHIRSISALEKV